MAVVEVGEMGTAEFGTGGRGVRRQRSEMSRGRRMRRKGLTRSRLEACPGRMLSENAAVESWKRKLK